MSARATASAVAVFVLLAGCGEKSGNREIAPSDTSPTTRSESAQVAVPRSYRFVLTSSCGERGLLGDYRVTVRNDVVAGVENLNQGYPYQPERAEIPTLLDLIAMAERTPATGVVEYVVDDDGLPRSLSLDPIPEGIDDEECYEVSRLVRLGE